MMILAALLAAWLPAWRASRLDRRPSFARSENACALLDAVNTPELERLCYVVLQTRPRSTPRGALTVPTPLSLFQ
jgi:hypothetical protein